MDRRKIMLLIIAVAALLITAKSVLSKTTTADDASVATNQVDETVREESNKPETNNPGVVERQNLSSADLDSLNSVIAYKLHKEIERKLDPISFDKALVAYLKDELSFYSSEEAIGIIKATDTGEIRLNLNDGSWSFFLDLGMDDVVECVVSSEGKYSFY